MGPYHLLSSQMLSALLLPELAVLVRLVKTWCVKKKSIYFFLLWPHISSMLMEITGHSEIGSYILNVIFLCCFSHSIVSTSYLANSNSFFSLASWQSSLSVDVPHSFSYSAMALPWFPGLGYSKQHKDYDFSPCFSDIVLGTVGPPNKYMLN